MWWTFLKLPMGTCIKPATLALLHFPNPSPKVSGTIVWWKWWLMTRPWLLVSPFLWGLMSSKVLGQIYPTPMSTSGTRLRIIFSAASTSTSLHINTYFNVHLELLKLLDLCKCWYSWLSLTEIDKIFPTVSSCWQRLNVYGLLEKVEMGMKKSDIGSDSHQLFAKNVHLHILAKGHSNRNICFPSCVNICSVEFQVKPKYFPRVLLKIPEDSTTLSWQVELSQQMSKTYVDWWRLLVQKVLHEKDVSVKRVFLDAEIICFDWDWAFTEYWIQRVCTWGIQDCNMFQRFVAV